MSLTPSGRCPKALPASEHHTFYMLVLVPYLAMLRIVHTCKRARGVAGAAPHGRCLPQLTTQHGSALGA